MSIYIPPHKREKQLVNKSKQEDFPELISYSNNNDNKNNNNSKWNKKISFSKLLNNSNTVNSSNKKYIQNDFIKNQKQNREKLFKLTLEQAEREKLNLELQQDSPYWNEKNLLDPDTDNSEEEYDVNKQEETYNNDNTEETL